jgi:amino acid transporter
MSMQSLSEPRGAAPLPAAAIGLRRSLTLTHAVLYGLGVTVGAGIYVLIAAAAGRAGMHAPISFVITAVLIALTGASLSELGSRMPVAAGEAAFARAAFRSERIATFIGVLVIAMALISASTISVGAAGYIRVFVDLPDKLVITGVIVIMAAVAARGIVESVTFAGLMTVIEIGGLVAIVAAGFWLEPAVITRAPEMLPSTVDAAALSGIFTASLLAVFAFIGFEGIVNIAEEMKEPERTLPRAIFLTLAITTGLYVLVMWVSLAALGPEALAASKAPLALVFEHLTGGSPRTLSAIAIVATLNGIVINIIMASRVMYGLSRHGSLPPALGRVNAVTQTPLIATGLSAAIVLAFALILPIAELADLSARITLVMFGLINLALLVIKLREDEPPAGIFRCPKWVPLLGFLSCVLFVAADLAIVAAEHR